MTYPLHFGFSVFERSSESEKTMEGKMALDFKKKSSRNEKKELGRKKRHF